MKNLKSNNLLTSIHHKDIEILLTIQSGRSKYKDQIWLFMTRLGTIPWFWMFISAMLCLKSETRIGGYQAFCAGGIEMILVHAVFKRLTKRKRPFDLEPKIRPIGKIPLDLSFPSGHACLAFTCTLLYFLYLPLYYSIPLFIIAAMISYSRMYLGVHYPSDILCGFILAILIDIVTILLFRI